MSYSKWKRVRLGDVAEIQTGPFGSQLHQKDYVLNGTPIITVEHLGENHIIHENLPMVSDFDKERLKKYSLQNGDIVFSRVGSVDRRAIVKEEEAGWLFSGRCLRVRPIFQGLNNHFLSYFFGLNSFKEHIRAIAVGSTMPSLNTKILSDIEIPLPPLNTQNKIAEILSSLDDKINLNRQTNATLEAIAQAIFKEWFTDFNFPGATDEMVESELGLIPKGWRIGSFNDLLNNDIGGDWGEDNEFESSMPVISLRGTDLDKLKSIGYSPNAPLRWVKKNSLEKRKISSKDILIAGSGLGPIGRSIYCSSSLNELYPFPISYSNFCKKLNAESEANAIYAERQLETLYVNGEMRQYFTGTSIPNLDIKSLLSHKILIPDEDVIRKYYLEVGREKFLLKFNNESTCLSQIRDLLLPKLMSGEIEL